MAVCAAACVACFGLFQFSNNEADVDLWGNVGFVTSLPWQDGYLRANTYSFTEPDRLWVNHEWLAQYVYNAVFRCCGNAGLLLVKILLGFLVLGIATADSARSNVSGPLRFLFTLLFVSTIGYGFSTRPHLFTYLLLAMLLVSLRRDWLRKPSFYPVCLLGGVLWANLHGAFFIGIITLFIFGSAAFFTRKPTASTRRALPAIAAACLLIAASSLNPYGLMLWDFISDAASRYRPFLSEWAMFNPLRDFQDHADFLLLGAVSLPALVRPKRTGPEWRCLLAASLAAAVLMRRNIPIFAIVAAFVVPAELDARVSRPLATLAARVHASVKIPVLTASAVLLLGAVFLFNKTHPAEMEVPRDKYAVDAIRFMKEHNIRGNAVIFFDWAEMAIWHLYPDCRVFLDGRFDCAYSRETSKVYFDFIYAGEHASKAIDGYPTDIALLHVGNPATRTMLARNDWALVYNDPIACIFVRKSLHTDLLEKLGSTVTSEGSRTPAYFP